MLRHGPEPLTTATHLTLTLKRTHIMTLTIIFTTALIAIFALIAITSDKWMKQASTIVAVLGLGACMTYLLLSPVWLSVANGTQLV